MNIKTKDLKTFQRLSSHIKSNGVLPSSDCIKFGDGKIVKNVSSAFVTFDCADSNESVLVDEFVLNSLINATVSDFINISVKDKKVLLSDGRDKVSVGIVSVKEFAVLPESETKKQEITTDFLQIFGRAADAAADRKPDTTLYMLVHVGDNMMAAGNGWMGVCFPINEDYKIVIYKDIAKFISKQNVYAWSESENYYFFYAHDGVVFGFSKQSIGFSGMGKAMNGGNEIAFSISAADVLSFNSLGLSLSTDKEVALATIAPGQFEMENTAREIPCIRPCEALKPPEPFNYNPEYMNKAIIALGVEELDFYASTNAYFIKSTETKATAIIAKMSK